MRVHLQTWKQGGMWAQLGVAMIALSGCASTVPDAYIQSCNPSDQPQRRCIQAVPGIAAALPVGGKAVARVDAQCHWNRSGVLLQPAATYEIAVTGRIEAWKDSDMPEADLATGWTGAVGSFFGALARWFARDPGAPMYALVGAQGQRAETFFVAGQAHKLRATAPDELLFFANDWKSRYGNNHGCLELSIHRVE